MERPADACYTTTSTLKESDPGLRITARDYQIGWITRSNLDERAGHMSKGLAETGLIASAETAHSSFITKGQYFQLRSSPQNPKLLT